MFEIGDIVYHDKLVFSDKTKDGKKNRPCIVLFSIFKNNQGYVCTCPLTSHVKTFNKRPYNYLFIPEVVYNYRKLNFAKLNDVNFYKEENTHHTGIKVDIDIVKLLKNKIIIRENKNQVALYNEVRKYLNYIELFEYIENQEIKKQIKLQRTLKKRISKKSL